MADKVQRYDFEGHDGGIVKQHDGDYVLHSEYSKLETELGDAKRALEIIVVNYLDGNPIAWALEKARRERTE